LGSVGETFTTSALARPFTIRNSSLQIFQFKVSPSIFLLEVFFTLQVALRQSPSTQHMMAWSDYTLNQSQSQTHHLRISLLIHLSYRAFILLD